MFGLGFSEVFFIAVLALLLIGPKELPTVARTVGRLLNELKRVTGSLADEFKLEVKKSASETIKKQRQTFADSNQTSTTVPNSTVSKSTSIDETIEIKKSDLTNMKNDSSSNS